MKHEKIFEIVKDSPYGVETKEVFVRKQGSKKLTKIRKPRRARGKLCSPVKKEKPSQFINPQKIYAIRTDDEDLPVIEELTAFEKKDEPKTLFFSRTSNFKNRLYTWDTLHSNAYLSKRAVSECYSRGWYFYSFGDATRRLRAILEKEQTALEKHTDKVARLAARIDNLDNEGVIDSY